MTRVLLLTITLTAVYLLVLKSVQPGDVLTGAALSIAIAAASTRVSAGERVRPPLAARLAAAPRLVAGALADIVRGTWHVARHVVGRRRLATPGFVAIPKGARTPSGVAVWGYLTTLSPDEIVVDVDDERGVLLVHVLNAAEAAAIRDRHHDVYERRQRRVFP